ncbi:FtsK/SpoIIIE domain-containing protein [Agromyces humatus]|uniref:FtsK domain-containing protein n=1 Tax=Agromyces humatus TaxID=279573 RepID=A0ABN2K4Z5_9MICO|nr:FtsK/SpoIIIE domain-containing protein [Agromyces humatus]
MRPLEPTEPPVVDLPLALPSPPGEPERPAFPLLAVLAPVVGALALWAITGSPFSLVFAILGPVVAVASVFDAKRQGRARLRRARVERARRLDELRAEIEVRHECERRAAWRRAPSPASLVARTTPPAWQGGPLPAIVVGSGPIRSHLRVDGSPTDSDERQLLARAASLEGAPVLADPYGGVGFVGARPLALAAARAALVQCAHHGVPGELALELPRSTEWEWAARLPHSGTGTERLRVLDRGGGGAPANEADPPSRFGSRSNGRATGGTALIAVATETSALPPGLQTIVHVDAPGSAFVRRPGGVPPAPVVPAVTGAADALAWAEASTLVAERAGVATAGAELPARVVLGELDQPVVDRASRASLAVAVGAAGAGPLVIDLVHHGPHALVAGTTGSGKSEFLLSWLTGLARAYPPDRVAFLLVDFKGGAAFEPIRELPHVTGIVTDLDEGEAERAVMSLRAELRHRERVLAQAGARDIRSLDAGIELARLVLVVDEFQAMIERFPDLGSVIADIAARGRSLGVHLVLASQRPNGVVREQITANCAIRVSLRVMQRTDSLAVVGTESAAEIAPDTPGRGIVDRGDGRAITFQSAVADVAALTGARVANAAGARARRPWLDPLPSRVGRDRLVSLVRSAGGAADAAAPRTAAADTDGFAIGLADEPHHQRRSLATWTPAADGHLLVLGAPGSGRTGALAAAAGAVAAVHGTASVLLLDGARSAVWDTLHGLLAAVRGGGDCPRLVVIDDLDVRFRSWPDDYRLAALDAVEALLREGRARGLWVAAAVSQGHGLGSGLRDAFGARLLLHHATRSDLVQSGGVGGLWRADEPPGSAQWRGLRVQVVEAEPMPQPEAGGERPLVLQGGGVHAVVAAGTSAAAAAIRSAGAVPILIASGADVAGRAVSAAAGHPGPTVIVGDADAWAANWAMAARIREEAVIVVHGGAPEYRALIRDRALPPLLDEGGGQCWASFGGAPARRYDWPPTIQPNPAWEAERGTESESNVPEN